MFGLGLLGLFAGVAAALALHATLANPGRWPVAAFVVCTVLGVLWALHGGRHEIRRIREEYETRRRIREPLEKSKDGWEDSLVHRVGWSAVWGFTLGAILGSWLDLSRPSFLAFLVSMIIGLAALGEFIDWLLGRRRER
jgi:uncharacterized membrane protein YoaK (UPF0700 family)